MVSSRETHEAGGHHRRGHRRPRRGAGSGAGRLERHGAGAPGGARRQDAPRAGRRCDPGCRPHRLHHALGIRTAVRRCRHHAGRRVDAAARRHPRPARLVTDRNPGSARQPGPVGRRHRRFRRPTRGGWLPRLLRPRQANLRHAGDAFPAQQASHAAVPRASGGRALHAGDQPVRHDDARAGQALHRSSSAPVVRPLRHLLRLVALSRAGHAHAGGPCGTRRRLACARRHAPPGGSARPRGRAARCRLPLQRIGW